MNSYKKIIRQYQGFVLSAGIFIVVIIGIFIGIIPAFGSIITMRQNTQTTAQQIEILSQKAQLLESLDEDTYKGYLTDLALAVPTDKALTSLFATIDGLSNETGVTLSDFTLTRPGSIATESAKRLSAEEKQVGSSFLPFTLTVTGTYNQIRSFVEKSIQVRRFFRVRFFVINFGEKETISVHMGMDAYFAPLPTNLGSAQQAVEPLTAQDQETISRVASLPVLGKEDQYTPQNTENAVQTVPREDPFSL